MRRIIASLVLATSLSAAPAQAVLLRGMGVENCASWLKDREGPDMIAYREWFLGYLSATAYLRNQDVLRDLSYDQMLAKVTATCQRAPARRLDSVLDEFFAR
jgi:hypothetical protein